MLNLLQTYNWMSRTIKWLQLKMAYSEATRNISLPLWNLDWYSY